MNFDIVKEEDEKNSGGDINDLIINNSKLIDNESNNQHSNLFINQGNTSKNIFSKMKLSDEK